MIVPSVPVSWTSATMLAEMLKGCIALDEAEKLRARDRVLRWGRIHSSFDGDTRREVPKII